MVRKDRRQRDLVQICNRGTTIGLEIGTGVEDLG